MAGSSEPFPGRCPSLRLTLGHPKAGFLLIMSSLGWVLTLMVEGGAQAHCHVEMSFPCSDLLSLHRPPVICPSGQQGPAQVSLLAHQGPPYQGVCPPQSAVPTVRGGLAPVDRLWMGLVLPVSALEGCVNT